LSLLEQVNGGLLKAAAVLGFAAVAFLVVVLLAWFARHILGVSITQTWETITSIFVLVLGGTAGVSYVGKHKVDKKE